MTPLKDNAGKIWDELGIEISSVIIVLIILLIAILYQHDVGENKINGFFAQMESNNASRDSLLLTNCNVLQTNNILKIKNRQAENYQKVNKYIITTLFPAYFTCIISFPILGGILAVITFMVAQKGWKDTSANLKTHFVLFAVLTSLFGLFPTVFNQKENIDVNLANYMALEQLQSKIADYKIICNSDNDSLFISEINKELISLNRFPFRMEQKSLPVDNLKLNN